MFYYKRSMHTLSTTRELCTYFLLQKKHMQFPLQENHAYTFSYKRSMHILPYRRTITHTFPYNRTNAHTFPYKRTMHTFPYKRSMYTLYLTGEPCTLFSLKEKHACTFPYKRTMYTLSLTREPCTHWPLQEMSKEWAGGELTWPW